MSTRGSSISLRNPSLVGSTDSIIKLFVGFGGVKAETKVERLSWLKSLMGKALRGDRSKNNLILWVAKSLFQLLKSQGSMVGVVITSSDGVSFHME
jgi:hypothetical protein